MLALQRSVGNRAVSALLAGHDGAPVQRSAVHEVLRGSGRPLETGVRAEMESRLGADFGDVRLHNDAAAQRSAAGIGARAYTSGSHIVVGQGGADRHTLAHELTHVIQQRQGPVAGTATGDGLSMSDPSDSFERAAEANATRAVRAPARRPGRARPARLRRRVARAPAPAHRWRGGGTAGRGLRVRGTVERAPGRGSGGRGGDQGRAGRGPGTAARRQAPGPDPQPDQPLPQRADGAGEGVPRRLPGPLVRRGPAHPGR
ncbi:DUF4157 domain-containing protein [Streptacidiphilus sp. 4-A2]|nr:DUF4157 domain-containing protein [Streptacidiphilus sp. 4-A2]